MDVLSLQIDILSITMAAVGIGLGVVGLIGYQSMKDGALEKASRVAEKVATDAASRHMENIRQSVEGLKSGNEHHAGDPTSQEPTSTEEEHEGIRRGNKWKSRW